MGKVAILVIWLRPNIYTFFPSLLGNCTYNLIEIGPVISEEKSYKMFTDYE